MAVRVQDTIKPLNDADFPVVGDGDIKGGFRTVANVAARDAITTSHRSIGMMVVTQDDGKRWQLGADLTTWTEFTGGGGSFTPAGDLSGDGTSQTVSSIRGIGSPDPNSASPGYVPTIVTVTPFSIPTDIVWDSAASKLWVADLDNGSGLFVYDPATRRTVSHLISPFDGISGFAKIDIDNTYVYAIGGAAVSPTPTATMFIFNRATGAIVGAGFPNKPTGIVYDGAGHIFVAIRNNLEKYTRATTLAAYPSVDTATATLAISGCNAVAWDGTNIFVTNGASSQVLKVNPTSMTITGTFTHPGGQTANFVFSAFGYIWGIFEGSIYRITASSMTGTATTGISGAVNLKGAGSDGTHLWVGDSSDYNIRIINPTTNARISTVTGSTNPSDLHSYMTYNGTHRMWLTAPSSSSIASHDSSSPYGEDDYFTSSLDLEYQASGGSSFTAAGDLSGDGTNQTVVGLQANPVSASAPSTGNALAWSGSAWAPTAPGGDLSGTFISTTVSKLQGRTMLSTAPLTSQVIAWNGSAWEPATPTVPTSFALGEGFRLPQRSGRGDKSTEFTASPFNYLYVNDANGTFGPNEGWGGSINSWDWTLVDMSAWGSRGLAVLGTNPGGGNKIWYIASRITGSFRVSASAGAPPPLVTFNIGGATGSATWTIIEGAWGNNGLTSPSGIYGDITGILIAANPTTGDICRISRGATPALLDPVVNLATGPIAMSKILWTGGLYAWIVAGGTLYRLSNLFQQGTNFSGSTAITATAVSGLPAGVVSNELATDGTYLYVPDSANTKIHKISLTTNLFVSSITTPAAPNNLVYDGQNFWFTTTSAFSPAMYAVNASGSTLKTLANGAIASGLFPLTNGASGYIQGYFNGEYIVFVDPSGVSVKFDPATLQMLECAQSTPCKRLRAFADGFPSDGYVLSSNTIYRLPATDRRVVQADRLMIGSSIAMAGLIFTGASQTVYLEDSVAGGSGGQYNASRIYANTKTAGITFYLPRRPEEGMEVLIKDNYGRASTNNITIKTHRIYAGSSSGALTSPGGVPTFTDATVQNSSFLSTGAYNGDLIVISSGPSGAHVYRLGGGALGSTSTQLDEVSVTVESGVTYTITEALEKFSGGKSDTDTISTAWGYRRYQYTRGYGWQCIDGR